MKTSLAIIVCVVVVILGFLTVYSQQHDMVAQAQGQAAGGGYGAAPAAGGYGAAPAAGGYGAPAAGGYGAPAAGGYGAPAAGGYGAPAAPATGGYK